MIMAWMAVAAILFGISRWFDQAGLWVCRTFLRELPAGRMANRAERRLLKSRKKRKR